MNSDGWKAFVGHVIEEWEGSGYRSRMNSALTTAKGDTASLDATRVVHATSENILRLMNWPMARIDELEGHTE